MEGRHFEAITFSIGNSAETLYLYLLGGMAHWLGPTTLAIQLPSWLAALACIWLVWKLVACITDRVPAWVPLLLAGCSLWLLHYARSGLRAICSPLFLALFAILLDRAERRPMNRIAGLLCGGILVLSIYGYTSNRALVIAFVLYAAFRLARPANARAALIRIYATIALGALVPRFPTYGSFCASRGSSCFAAAMCFAEARATGSSIPLFCVAPGLLSGCVPPHRRPRLLL